MHQNQDKNDSGTLVVLLERLNKQDLPRAMVLKAHVAAGKTLSDEEIAFLEHLFAEARDMQPLIERHPEHQELIVKVISLYQDILAQDLANEGG